MKGGLEAYASLTFGEGAVVDVTFLTGLGQYLAR